MDHGVLIWLIVAVGLFAFELASLNFIFAMGGVAALVGAVVTSLGAPEVVSVPVAAVTAVALLAFLRPNILRRLHSGADLRTGAAALVGRSAMTLTELSPNASGRVKIGGDEWTALPYPGSPAIEAGTPVQVVEIKGATAYVLPSEGV